jgi:fructosamine-3-kinase
MPSLADALSAALGIEPEALERSSAAAGAFGRSTRFATPAGDVFVKSSERGALAMYEAEAEGLATLAAADCLRVPRVLAVGATGTEAYLALEYIEFGSASRRTEQGLGELLARQHRATAANYGWHRDNTIGATPQSNAWRDDWVAFWRDLRLRAQLERAERRGARAHLIDRGHELLAGLAAWFTDYRPVPSLLHGDLWGGNWAADTRGEPVVYDPAVYYGDRETDLAMTRLFGGFGATFHAAYEAAWPLDPGAVERRDLYNLYHVLNHYSLFGGGYEAQADAMIDRLLGELGH